MRSYAAHAEISTPLPKWLPRKPLVAEMLVDSKSDEFLEAEDLFSDEASFFVAFIDKICERDTAVRAILNAEIIKQILLRTSRETRKKASDVGPITMRDLEGIFYDVTGSLPIDEASVMLQRLPGMGRVSAETSDRQFYDPYISDGLRGLDFAAILQTREYDQIDREWRNPLRRIGIEVFVNQSKQNGAHDNLLSHAKVCANQGKNVAATDLISSMLTLDQDRLDFRSAHVSNSHLWYLDLSGKDVKNLSLHSCIIEEMSVESTVVHNVSFSECVISRLIGVSAREGLPVWIRNCDIDEYAAINNVATINSANLGIKRKVLLTILHKVFFQPGTGRKESSLLRGLGGEIYRKRDLVSPLKILTREGVISSFPGDEGPVYIPNRGKTKRVARIMAQLDLSEDPIWIEAGE